MQGLTGYLIAFAVIAGFAIAIGFVFGIFNQIVSQLNSDPNNPLISQSFIDAINLAQNLASTGILLAVAAVVIGLAMLVVGVIRAHAGA